MRFGVSKFLFEFLVRKFDSTRQTTFCVDQSGLLFYGYGLQDPPSLMLKRKESEPRSRTQDKLLEGSSELEPPLSAIQPTSSSLQSSVRCQWWWDQLVMDHFLKESADSDNHGS